MEGGERVWWWQVVPLKYFLSKKCDLVSDMSQKRDLVSDLSQ